ncbi:MAG TPA: iron-sulfur cluster repair di-iron protein [Bacteroidia bacterium]|nr:iron-sulfur cluster repair di-iron protein [Bacteroidia bacterium]
MISTSEKTIGQIVAEDFRSASVFKAYGIDFCCKGNRVLDDVCKSKGLPFEKISHELTEALSRENQSGMAFNTWPLDLLIDFIEKKHHRYVEQKSVDIKGFLDKLCRVHGERHPELFEINREFTESASELAAHMKKEELVLFPYIRQMIKAKLYGGTFQTAHFGTVQNPIEMMENEHEAEGERYRRIAQLSNNYTTPEDGCTTYRVAFAMLKEFEEDLHQHIHLENNILFPNALETEMALR